jgi:hypothetical protein
LKYRKKPVVVDAICFTGHNHVQIRSWQKSFGDEEGFWGVSLEEREDDPDILATIYDKLHSTNVGVKMTDWIIRGIKGEYYPCDAAVFYDTYEEVR